MNITADKFKDIMVTIADSIEDNVEYLTELDAKIGGRGPRGKYGQGI